MSKLHSKSARFSEFSDICFSAKWPLTLSCITLIIHNARSNPSYSLRKHWKPAVWMSGIVEFMALFYSYFCQFRYFSFPSFLLSWQWYIDHIYKELQFINLFWKNRSLFKRGDTRPALTVELKTRLIFARFTTKANSVRPLGFWVPFYEPPLCQLCQIYNRSR